MRSLRVLIVEDQPFQLMALHQMLNASGVYDVLTAANLADACRALARRGPVDLAICDVNHDRCGAGRELLQHLALSHQAAAVVMLSQAEQGERDEAVRQARQAGLWVLAALQKPVKSSTLHQVLELYQQNTRCTERARLAL